MNPDDPAFEDTRTRVAPSTSATGNQHDAGLLPLEQQAIRARCFHPTGTFVEFTRDEIEQSLPRRFETIVARYPHRLALHFDGQAWTYDALNQSANRVARSLLNLCGKAAEPAALVGGRDGSAIGAYLGILKAGKIAVVIDPSFPPEWAARILAASNARYVLSAPEHLEYAKGLVDEEDRVLRIDAMDENLADGNLGLAIAPEATAQVLYSSGSTGQPKGVFFNHRRLLYDVMENVNAAHICPDDHLTYMGSITFGAGIKELFRAILTGAAIFPYDINRDGLSKLPAFLRDHGITIFKPGIATFRYFVRDLNGSESFPHIRLLMLGGGAVSADDVAAYKRVFSDRCVLLHHLSCTEAGMISVYFIDKRSEIDGAQVPAGYPVKDKEIYLVDEQGAKAGINEIGEIAVRSRYVSSGYWDDPRLSDTKFLGDPTNSDTRICLTGDLGLIRPDGCLVHKGRKELQVKIRGFRVEIGHVETELHAIAEVRDAVVIATPGKDGEMRLTAYLVPGQSPVTLTGLRRVLREKLPDYMIPERFVLVSKIPMTPNGKPDRKALPDPSTARLLLDTAYVAPATNVEKQLARIWSAAFGCGAVGIHDDFVELGGHSLLAARIVANTQEAFGVELSVRQLLDSGTIAGMARLILASRANAGAPAPASTPLAADEETDEI